MKLEARSNTLMQGNWSGRQNSAMIEQRQLCLYHRPLTTGCSLAGGKLFASHRLRPRIHHNPFSDHLVVHARSPCVSPGAPINLSCEIESSISDLARMTIRKVASKTGTLCLGTGHGDATPDDPVPWSEEDPLLSGQECSPLVCEGRSRDCCGLHSAWKSY